MEPDIYCMFMITFWIAIGFAALCVVMAIGLIISYLS